MKNVIALLFVSSFVPALSATYTVSAGSSAAAIQAIVNVAGAAPGNTVMFSAGNYSLAYPIWLPCANGTVYTGPNVGVVTQANMPTAVLSSRTPSNYALRTNSNGTSFTGSQGCTIQFLTFSGTQGGIYVTHPSSGIVIQNNYFTLNDPPAGGYSLHAIYLDGNQEQTVSALNGASYITIVWNVFYNNCAQIIAAGAGNGHASSGGYCAATLVSAYNNYLVWSNNTVNGIEEGLKMLDMSSGPAPVSMNADVENNNLQGNSRIMIESQIDTNGVATYSHNAFYNPANPSNGTFEMSIPETDVSPAPTHIADDNVYIGAVPITGETGPDAHYGLGLEIWGPGGVASNSLFQGGNGPESCGAGYGCYGWVIAIGGSFTDASVTGNYFSGSDVWAGSATDVNNAISYENGASSANRGLVIEGNTVVQTSTTIPTVAPTISAVPGPSGTTITLSDSDTAHRLSIFYTIDGSTPAIFGPGGSAGTTQLYSVPFTVPAGTTVKAIASWGQGANQGIVFPVFGYVPSSVVTSGSVTLARTITNVTLQAKPGTPPLTVGGTMQVVATATYSDGTTATLPDALGNKVTAWNTSNHSVARISSQGHATAMAQGPVNIMATVGSLVAAPMAVNVSGSASPVATPAETLVAEAVPAVAASPVPEVAAAAEPAAREAPGAAESPGEPNPTPSADQNPASPAASGTQAPISGPVAPPISGPVPSAPAGPLPDNFIGPFWNLENPAGGSASISNAHLFIAVPGGANHDPFTSSNQAVRVVQAIGNENFDVAIKIDSPLVATDGNTSQGLMVLAGGGDFLSFALTTDGTRVGLMARTVTRGVATTVLDDSAFSQYQNPTYLRLLRTGSAYVAFYSVDGESWTQAASFTDSIATAAIGPFASNYSDTPANAAPVVMSVNWFEVR